MQGGIYGLRLFGSYLRILSQVSIDGISRRVHRSITLRPRGLRGVRGLRIRSRFGGKRLGCGVPGPQQRVGHYAYCDTVDGQNPALPIIRNIP